MKVIRAEHLGMCFGVRDAIALAREHADAAPLTILGDLVHNATVLSDLRARGILIARNLTDVTTERVMVTAHGASGRALAKTRTLGLQVVEATCPLVHVAHRAVRALVRDGYHPVIVGRRDHVEVRGMTEDLDAFDVVLDDEDVRELDEHPRIGVAAQTPSPWNACVTSSTRSAANSSAPMFASSIRSASPRSSASRPLSTSLGSAMSLSLSAEPTATTRVSWSPRVASIALAFTTS